MRNSQEGFTIIELLILIVVLAFFTALIVGILTLCMGNFWITEDGVLRKIQFRNPQAVQILDVERRVWDYSLVTVKNKDGTQTTYIVDANVLFNYRVKPF